MKAVKNAYNNLIDNVANTTTRNESVSLEKENREAWYAVWDDNYLENLISNKIVKTILCKIADHYYGEEVDEILNQSTELTSGSYPCLFSVYDDCCNILGMYNRPKAYITGKMKGINALSLEVRGKQMILISPKVATHLSEKEQSFLLGHEISHHQQGNLVCHTVNGLLERMGKSLEILGPLVMDAIEVPLKRWCRCSELNADRGGYLCCGDLKVIDALFVRLGLGTGYSSFGEYKELSDSHPLIYSRLKAINEYAEKLM